MSADDSGSLSWEDLDDDYELFTVGDTADLSGVVTIADDAFFDGIDYTFPTQEPQKPQELPLDVVTENQLATRQPSQLVKQGPRHAAIYDAYQVPDEDDDDEGSWIPIIIGAVIVLALLGGLLWLIFGSSSCSRENDTRPSQEQTQPADDEQTDDEQTTPTDNQQTTPVTPVTPEKDDENQGREATPTEPEDEDEKDTEPEEDTKPEDETTPTQPTGDPVWIPEQGHFEPSTTWVVDKEAWDEPVYDTVLVDTIHHDEVTRWVDAWDEEGEDGQIIHHDGYEEVVTPEYDEPVYDTVLVDTIHHDAEGHTVTTQKWIVDTPGHWQYPDGTTSN